jgi:transcriptional regulator with XRE-family HTH domain
VWVIVEIMSAAAGDLLREWRLRRRLTQLDLASDAEISTRHLSFVETGRANPSREMVLRLAERLSVPLRERNAILVAAGFAPVFPERPLADPALDPVRKAIDIVLEGHEPYPALAIDRHWTMVATNRITPLLLGGLDPAVLQPPVNVLRMTLHPRGLAQRIANFATLREHILERLRRQIDLTADPVLIELMRELREYPSPPHPAAADRFGGVLVPLELNTDLGRLSFFSTTTIFGTPVEITVSELAIESFFPADAATAEAMRQLDYSSRS